MSTPKATPIGLRVWAGLIFLLTLPVAFLALVSYEKLIRAVDLRHGMMELLLTVATIAGLGSPLALTLPRRSWQLRVLMAGTVAVAIALAALFSPLSRGFFH